MADFAARAREIIAADPVNEELTAAGRLPITNLWFAWPSQTPASLPSFAGTYRKTGALTSGVGLLHGLAKLFGYTKLSIAGVTDSKDNDYRVQAQGALEALRDHDFVIIHVESPDEAGHDGDVNAKIKAIEAIDSLVLPELLTYAAANSSTRIYASPDHPTPVALKTHVREPVPFVLWGDGIQPDAATTYSENSARATGWLIDPGYKVVEELFHE